MIERLKRIIAGEKPSVMFEEDRERRRSLVQEILELMKPSAIILDFVNVKKDLAAGDELFEGADFVVISEHGQKPFSVCAPAEAEVRRGIYPHVAVVTVNLEDAEEASNVSIVRQILAIMGFHDAAAAY